MKAHVQERTRLCDQDCADYAALIDAITQLAVRTGSVRTTLLPLC